MPQWVRQLIPAAFFLKTPTIISTHNKAFMKAHHSPFGDFPLFAVSFLLLVAPATATPIFTTVQSGPNTPPTITDEVAFAADVSSTDLLHGITGTGGDWFTGFGGVDPSGLNDGTHGGDYDAVGIDALTGASFAKEGTVSFREFSLGSGNNGLGFDITGIQSIAAWQGAGFQNQKYEIYISTVGSASFTLLSTVNYQPAPWVSTDANDAKGGATKVNLTDDTGLLATGVDAIRFNILDSVSINSGGVVMREIDVFGFATVGGIDNTPPLLTTLFPTDNATHVSVTADLVATFNENIAIGSGNITIKNLTTPDQTTVVTLPDPRVSVSGAVLTINLSANLATPQNYAVQIDAGAISDLSNNPFAGTSDETTWNFATAAAPLRIMCLGDSITAGYTDNPGWTTDHLFKFGYRSGLHTRLTHADYNFLFVGASAEPWNNAFGDPSRGGTYTPDLDLRSLGQDGHRGYGGASTSMLQTNIISWLNSDNPDIVLLEIGTNGQSTTDLDTLVNTIVTTKPNAHLIIAEIIPTFIYSSAIVNYNSYIRNTLVPNYQAQGKNIILVNQYAPFLTNPANLTTIDQSLFSNGINHPDNDGYEKMAQIWLDGINALGLAPNTFKNWISEYPNVGNQTGLDQDPDGDGTDNGVENFFGTAPDQSSPGLMVGVKAGNSFTFTHPQAATPASGITGSYLWSKDLSSFHADGVTDNDGTTVTFVIQSTTPTAGTTTVTSKISGTPSSKLFLRVSVR